MEIEVIAATKEDQHTFCNLWELYLYDFSEFNPNLEVNERGLYSDAPIHYWTDPNRHPFLIQVDDRPSGFVLVNLSEERNRIGQFFVMRKCRRMGAGREASLLSFDRFPGKWIVGVSSANMPAQTFWRSVISRYTDEHFAEKRNDDGIDFLFDNRPFESRSDHQAEPRPLAW